MKDYLIRGLAFNDEIRFFVTKTTDLVEEIRKRHDAYPTAIAATGRVATVTTMMGAMLKSGDRIDVAVQMSLEKQRHMIKICKFIFQVIPKGN